MRTVSLAAGWIACLPIAALAASDATGRKVICQVRCTFSNTGPCPSDVTEIGIFAPDQALVRSDSISMSHDMDEGLAVFVTGAEGPGDTLKTSTVVLDKNGRAGWTESELLKDGRYLILVREGNCRTGRLE